MTRAKQEVMNLEKLKEDAETAIYMSEEYAGEPEVFLTVPRMARGKTIRIGKGLTAKVSNSLPDPPRTLCFADAHEVLRFVERELRKNE